MYKKNTGSSTETIASEELVLQIAPPEDVHAVLADLPRIEDDSKEGAGLTRTVVGNCVQNNPNDLYILVKKASDDPANWPYSLREFIYHHNPLDLVDNTNKSWWYQSKGFSPSGNE
eukprot:Gregarina_sp_Poly_1__1122@NODE_1275_length_4520_cov_99_199192_g865_i0_p3_GENE_NODE_1275_length_4520_cov_99_199192_g865_i0NODE_1275_length_4520_cov_99_199192_g865_i0_p3_ORF_typecomplete_len116_score18_36Dynamin_N/PF00350_23/0_0011_NODE_1275_length_4520_cov_99_199192_g865_i025112858